jgi:hypothetical protein
MPSAAIRFQNSLDMRSNISAVHKTDTFIFVTFLHQSPGLDQTGVVSVIGLK